MPRSQGYHLVEQSPKPSVMSSSLCSQTTFIGIPRLPQISGLNEACSNWSPSTLPPTFTSGTAARASSGASVSVGSKMGTLGNSLSGGLLGLLGLLLTAGIPFIGETRASEGKETGEELPVLRPGLEGSGKVWQESSDTGGKGALNPKWPSTKLEGGSEDMTSPPVYGEEAPSKKDATMALAIRLARCCGV